MVSENLQKSIVSKDSVVSENTVVLDNGFAVEPGSNLCFSMFKRKIGAMGSLSVQLAQHGLSAS